MQLSLYLLLLKNKKHILSYDHIFAPHSYESAAWKARAENVACTLQKREKTTGLRPYLIKFNEKQFKMKIKPLMR